MHSVSGSFFVVIATALCVSSGACSSYNTSDNKCFLCSNGGSDCAVTVALAGINTLREVVKRRAADLQHRLSMRDTASFHTCTSSNKCVHKQSRQNVFYVAKT